MFFDTEVQTHQYYGAKASPRHPDNYIVAEGHAIDTAPYDGAVEYTYFNSKEEAKNWLHIPDDVWLLVAHNAPFDLDWALATQREEIMRFLKRGGRIFCTAYAHYLLSNQQDTYPALDEIAPVYGGTHKVDGIKILWKQGYLTSEIDKDLLIEYLAGPNGDVENTRKVFYGVYDQLVQRGMWDMALLRMEGMLYNIFCMDAGLYVDREVAFKQLDELSTRIAEIKEGFQQYREHIPSVVEFKDSSDYHMSAWLFGGPIKYKERDVWLNEDGTPKYEKREYWHFEDGFRVEAEYALGLDKEAAITLVSEHGPVVKATAGKNKGLPKVFKEDSDEPKLKWYDKVYQCPPLVPLDLLPKDIRTSFEKEFTGKRKLSDESPVYSSGKDCLDMLSLRKEFPDDVKSVCKLLLEFAKLDKDVGTYYLREDMDEEGNVIKQSGMLQYLTPENIVHHILNCTSTVTGRLSSNRPNMQNIPRGDTSDVKRIFTSRFGADGYIIEADYSALEVVALAAFSKDTALVKALMDGTDMHCMRLSQQLNEPYEDVLKKCKDETHPQHKEYKTMRTHIKPKAFAYQYGATAQGIAFATGCTVEEAQEFIDAEKALFPEVETYYDEVITKYVEEHTSMHREQTENGAWRVYRKGVWQAPGGTCYEFREHSKVKWVDGQRHEVMEFKPTQIRNYPIQGESGFFVQGIAGQVVRWLLGKDFFNGKCYIINQVHDALYLDCHKDVIHEVCSTVKFIMESLPEFFKQYGYDLGVPFPAEVEFGPNMLEKEKFHE
jgi:hypothetical protein